MTQDNPNQPRIAEEPQSSDQNPTALINPVSERIANQIQIGEPVTEEEDEFTEDEEEESEGASLEDTVEAETSLPGNSSDSTPATNLPNPSVPEAENDERSELAKQPYDFDHCTVQIAIQLLPDDGDASGRQVVVGVRSHLDTPILRFLRMNELGVMPPIVATLLEELKTQLPAREQVARAAYEKKQAEKAKRQSNTAASKTPTRGKKNKPACLGASPTATVPDNRPRPEVKVSTAAQQQMGFF